VLLAGAAAGTINTIVGTGSLVSFPALLALGVPPVVANASNTTGLVPGGLSGTLGYRREFTGQGRRLRPLLAASLLGGGVGAGLLLVLPASAFEAVVPALVLLASVDDLRGLREGLRQLARANNHQDPDQSVLDDAAQTLAANPLTLRLGAAGVTPGLDATSQGPGARLLAAAAAAYLAESAAGTWGRIKACASPTCQYAFVDTSHNASRRWCDMSGCGNQAKQRSYRQRRSRPTT